MEYSEIAKCKYCGREFKKSTKRHVYCSSTCKEAFRLSQKPRFTGVCPVCGKTFEYIINGKRPHRKYCSTACQLKDTVPTKVCTCIDCGKDFEFKGRTTKLRCPECWKKHRVATVMRYRQEKDPSVQIGVGSGGGQNSSDALVNTEARDRVRAIRREQYKENAEYYRASASYKYRRILTGHDACEICGYNRYQDALVVHHKDMNRTHNDRSNLVILCSNCHVHLHTVIREAQKHEDITAESVYAREVQSLKADVKERNEAGTPDGVTRTEGCEESQSGATHIGTSRTDMSRQEAVPVQLTLAY